MALPRITPAQAKEVVNVTRKLLNEGSPKVLWNVATLNAVHKLAVNVDFRRTKTGVEVTQVKYRSTRKPKQDSPTVAELAS